MLRVGRPLLAALALALPGAAGAQTMGCTARTLSDPPRQVLDCADGLTMSAEQGAGVTLFDRNGDGKPDGVELSGKALLIDLPPGRGKGFQILTPHAIASVRGTRWAVDVGSARTSVFVERGAVAVARPRGQGVVLRPGDGVDVDAGGAPLTVKRWAPARAAALLARLRP